MTREQLQGSIRLQWALVLALVSCSILGMVSSVFGVTLSFIPSSPTVVLGQPVMVDVVVSDLGSASVGAFDLNVQFNPTQLQLNGVTFGLGLGDPALFESITISQIFAISPTVGVVNFSELSFLGDSSLVSTQGNPLTLATLRFQGNELGMSTLLFTDLGGTTVPPAGLSLRLTDGLGLPLSITSRGSADVSVTPVPDPNTFSLMLLGLIALFWLCRLRSNKRGGERGVMLLVL